ncbi:TonB-dependent receptor [Mangrovivirga sp. M17]|uniref:TonB-dependent receptor n=1 Tax=Mangrovivirga halotolerans TaxID=2993936 RepID=A0ABT3RR19_9BACT|nr:TonB-dependent receptor [Mangrovivirga halotolerans]MCX2743829.1 TonB-dependent receptor [Mangrovivirga halotolerans]
MKRLIGCFVLFYLLGANVIFAQELAVEGKVKDENGEFLPGVNVVIEGTTQGTVTNFNGYYTLTVPDKDSKLVFSFIGTETVVVPVNNRSTINVTLKQTVQELESVMVVAYGTTTEEAYTGAASVVDSKVIENRPVTSFEKSLQGTTPGLMVSSSSGQPGSGSTIRIRGIGSLSASSAPLFVLDGIPMSGSITDINPNDIESITVLKDAAASSLYGSRAANGVVLITTKQGKAGSTKISFNSQMGVSQRISKGYDLMNSTQFYEHSWMGLYNQALINGESIDDARAYAHANVKETVGYNPFGVDNPLDNNGQLIPGTQILTDTDWRDEIYKNGIIQNHNLSISGGSDLTKVFLSLGYFSDSGITLGSDFKRISNKINVSHKINSFLEAGLNSHLSYSKTNAPPSGSGGANPVRSAEVINAASPVYNEFGEYEWGNKAVFDFNPVGLAELDQYKYDTKRAVVNTYLNVKISPSFNFRTSAGIDNSINNGLNYYNPYHGNGAGVNGRTATSNTDNFGWNISNILTYSKATNNSYFEALIGQEALGQDVSILSAGVTDFSVPGRPELVWGSKPGQPSSATYSWTMASYLSQIKYDLNDKYFFSTSARMDGSSRFGKNNKYGLFYSVGFGWQLTQEDWMPEFKWLDNAKLRVSYGTSGNNNIGNYASLGLYGSGANYGGYPGLTPTQLANEDLSWEKIKSLNVGLELNLFRKLDASIEFYNRNSNGLLFARPLSAGTGFGSIISNLGAMKNTGVETALNYRLIENKNVFSSIGFNISFNTNEILELTTEQIVSGTKLLEEGSSIYQFYMREWAGVNPDNGRPMWYVNADSDDREDNTLPSSAYEDPLGSGRNVTSDYNDAERKRLGTSLPKAFGGLNYSLNYKNFELSMYFFYSLGGQVYNNDYATNMHDGTQPGSNLATDALNAWTPNNRYTDVPRYVKNNMDESNQMSSRFIEDASYLRLKNITIGYNFPSSLYESLKIRNLKAFLSGENLFTLTKYRGYDPEVAINGTTSNTIPGTKVITLGLKVEL